MNPGQGTEGLLTVVVIGRNEGSRLERCLRSVAAMHPCGLKIEVLYVDSGSTDQSVTLARSLGAATISVQSAHPTAALGRNAGWRAARGEFILFLDGDTVLDPDFVSQSLPGFTNPAMAVIWGHRRELYPTRTLYNRVLDLDWIYPPGLTLFCGGDALFRRTYLERTDGFDEHLIAGEEPELCRRILSLGGEILHVDRPMTGHDLAMSRFGQYWKRATRAGHAFAEVSSRFSHTPDPFWLEDARRNRTRALVLLTLPLLAVAVATALRSPWPVLLWILALGALAARTAWKARWKTSDSLALALYGIHSHFQQIPIYLGQLRFHRNRRSGQRAQLVEYKG